MIIFDDFTLQTRSDFPNGNWLIGCSDWSGPPVRYVVDDYSPLADKIMSAEFGWEPIEDEFGTLIDVTLLAAKGGTNHE
jgi:hypothetical protein